MCPPIIIGIPIGSIPGIPLIPKPCIPPYPPKPEPTPYPWGRVDDVLLVQRLWKVSGRHIRHRALHHIGILKGPMPTMTPPITIPCISLTPIASFSTATMVATFRPRDRSRLSLLLLLQSQRYAGHIFKPAGPSSRATALKSDRSIALKVANCLVTRHRNSLELSRSGIFQASRRGEGRRAAALIAWLTCITPSRVCQSVGIRRKTCYS